VRPSWGESRKVLMRALRVQRAVEREVLWPEPLPPFVRDGDHVLTLDGCYAMVEIESAEWDAAEQEE
jgi:hypothetical protein